MIVVLTALPIEQEAMLAHLIGSEMHRHPAGTLFDVGALVARRERRIAVGVTGAGALSAATLTERAITEFAPSALLFVGIAGGLHDWLEIGDIVVATKIHAYQGGRSEDDEFLVRPRSWEISHSIEQVARTLPRGNAWHASIRGAEVVPPGPSVHFEAVAAGDVVLSSSVSPLAQKIRRNFNDAVAIEMESSGFALAGHLAGQVPMATIRGISDRADATKTATDRQGSQRVAARNAAAFAAALAAALDDEEPSRSGSLASTPALPSVRNKNVARDHARVGQQIGVNFAGLFTDRTGERG